MPKKLNVGAEISCTPLNPSLELSPTWLSPKWWDGSTAREKVQGRSSGNQHGQRLHSEDQKRNPLSVWPHCWLFEPPPSIHWESAPSGFPNFHTFESAHRFAFPELVYVSATWFQTWSNVVLVCCNMRCAFTAKPITNESMKNSVSHSQKLTSLASAPSKQNSRLIAKTVVVAFSLQQSHTPPVQPFVIVWISWTKLTQQNHKSVAWKRLCFNVAVIPSCWNLAYWDLLLENQCLYPHDFPAQATFDEDRIWATGHHAV